MKLRAVRLRDVRRFGSPGIAYNDIKDGLSVIAEPNEFGKSTVFQAVRIALFFKHSSARPEVKSLLPNRGGGAPRIQMDLEVEGKTYRVTKQFLKKAHAEVVDLSTAQIIAKDGDAHDWILKAIGSDKPGEGPSGLLWVEQGLSMAQPDGGQKGGELLSQLLEREVGSVTGGERSRLYLQSARTRLEKLHTATGRSTGVFKTAETELATLQERSSLLQDKLAQSEQAYADLASTKISLKSLTSDEDQDAAAVKLEQAETRLADAKAVLKTLQTLRDAAEAAERAATSENERHSRLLQDHAEAEVTLGELITLANDQEATRKKIIQIDEDLETATQNVDAAQNTCDQAAEDERKAHEAEKIKTAKERVTRLEAVLERANEASASLKEAQQQAAKITVTHSVIETLEELTHEVAVGEGQLELVRPHLSMAYDKGADGKIKIGETVVVEDEDIALAPHTEIEIEGIGTLTIRSQEDEQIARNLARAKNQLSQALKDNNVGSMKIAQTEYQRQRDLKTSCDALKREIKEIVPDGIDVLKTEIEALKPQITETDISEIDPDTARQNREQAQNALGIVQAALAKLTSQKRDMNNDLIRLRSNSGIQQSRLDALIERIGPKETWPKNAAASEEQLSTVRDEAETLKGKLEKANDAAPDHDVAFAAVQRLKQSERNRADRITGLRERRAASLEQIKNLQAEGIEERLSENEDQIKVIEQKVSAYKADAEALNLLISVLTDTQQTLQDEFIKPVLRELNPLLKIVIPGGDIRLDSNFKPESLERNGIAENVNSLSGGTQEQIAILTRLAFAKLMSKRGRATPVIFDDALVYLDDDRLDKMFTALNVATSDGTQCLVLTCRQRAFSELGGQSLTYTDWTETSKI